MATMASMVMRAIRDASSAAVAASRAARSAPASRAARSAAAAASRAARSAAAAASCAARLGLGVGEACVLVRSGPTRPWKLRDEAQRRSKTKLYMDSDDPPVPSVFQPGKSVTDKDMESDEAIWALYVLWCKAYNKERDHAEMVLRFNNFKQSVDFVHTWNKAFVEQIKLGEFADERHEAPISED
ncbi:hypothetical protein ACP70R_037416 [Stipagrostis hirtigluma subsp. patula]